MIKLLLILLIVYIVLVQQKNPRKRDVKATSISTENPYEILGISTTAQEEEIRAAFKEQTRLNHPDLVANMSKDFQELAEEKIKRINWAYSEIRKNRNF